MSDRGSDLGASPACPTFTGENWSIVPPLVFLAERPGRWLGRIAGVSDFHRWKSVDHSTVGISG
jgi:hypothetical protein